LLVFGNGGSAADAEHFVTELVGRYRQERDPLPAVALTANTPQLTALANDLGYEQIFARQVRAFAKPGDVVIGISTSGRSVNVITGLQEARDRGAHTIALIGADIIGLAAVAETVISVPATDTPRVQEAHSVIIHILCDIIERALLSQQTKKVRGDENISR
jgi:D-sedoheptulose 7-phosphate isomerase